MMTGFLGFLVMVFAAAIGAAVIGWCEFFGQRSRTAFWKEYAETVEKRSEDEKKKIIDKANEIISKMQAAKVAFREAIGDKLADMTTEYARQVTDIHGEWVAALQDFA